MRRLALRRHWLRLSASAVALWWPGLGGLRAAAPAAVADGSADGEAGRPPLGTLRPVALRDVQRVDAAEQGGWWARDLTGRLWRVAATGETAPVASGLAPSGALATAHGRVAGRGLDGRLWVHDTRRPTAPPTRSELRLAPHGGLCILPHAVIAVVEQPDRHVLARFEPDARGQWQVVAQSREAVLPDAAPVAVDLDGQHGGAHIAVLAGPDTQRYPHAVLGDDVEATRVLWLERHSLASLRTLELDDPTVFEDRLLRPWTLPDGRTGLVTVRSGPLGAQLVVVAAASKTASALVLASSGPAIGTRNRWLSPASVGQTDGELWAVHTPHIGGVLHRYRPEGTALVAQRMATGLSNHRLGRRDLDVSARVGRWLLLPTQDWRGLMAWDTQTSSLVLAGHIGAPLQQLVASVHHGNALLLSASGLSIWSP